MTFARLAGAFGALVLAAAALTACQSHVGAAAFVGSDRISESTVATYVSRSAKITADSNGTPESPMTDVINTLIRAKLLDEALRSIGAYPDPAALATAVATTLTNTGVDSVEQLADTADGAGFTRAYAPIYVDEQAKLMILINTVKDPGDGSAVVAVINKLHKKITVNPRYGVWTDSSLSVSMGPTVPSYLTLSSSLTGA